MFWIISLHATNTESKSIQEKNIKIFPSRLRPMEIEKNREINICKKLIFFRVGRMKVNTILKFYYLRNSTFCEKIINFLNNTQNT